jgi:serine protease AprX
MDIQSALTTKDTKITKRKNPFVIFVSFVVKYCVLIPCFIALLSASTRYSNPPDWLAKVDPRVLTDTADGKTGAFLVVLSAQSDLGNLALDADGAYRVGDSVSRLQRVASANQAGLLAEIRRLAMDPANAIRYHPFWLVDSVAVSGKRAVVQALASLPEVVKIETDRGFQAVTDLPITPDGAAPQTASTAAGIQPNLTQVGVPAVWAKGDTGQGIVYANADTGVQWDHPALINQYRGWNASAHTADHNYNWHDAIHVGSSTGNPCGYDTLAPCDDNGHGTHTMGIGVGDDGAGNQVGVAPGTKWIACRNMDAGIGHPSTYVDCLEFLISPTDLSGNNPRPDLHADVISNSYSCPVSEGCMDITVLHNAVEAVRSAGIFMSVSVGNKCANSASNTQIAPPAVEPDVFTVGAVDNSNQIASFSSRGPFTYNGTVYQKPDLSAPGVGIVSSYPTNGYSSLSGTSMAAPHVAGTVALLWSAFPGLRGKVAETEAILRETANHLPGDPSDLCSPGGPSGSPNYEYGYGLLNVQAAYASLMPYHIQLPVINR